MHGRKRLWDLSIERTSKEATGLGLARATVGLSRRRNSAVDPDTRHSGRIFYQSSQTCIANFNLKDTSFWRSKRIEWFRSSVHHDRGGERGSSHCSMQAREKARASPRKLVSDSPCLMTRAPSPIHSAARHAEIPVGQAAHFQTDHGEVERIVVHRQFSQEDGSKIRNVDHVSERLRRRRYLNRLAVRAFDANVLDLDVFDQGARDSVRCANTCRSFCFPRLDGLGRNRVQDGPGEAVILLLCFRLGCRFRLD